MQYIKGRRITRYIIFRERIKTWSKYGLVGMNYNGFGFGSDRDFAFGLAKS